MPADCDERAARAAAHVRAPRRIRRRALQWIRLRVHRAAVVFFAGLGVATVLAGGLAGVAQTAAAQVPTARPDTTGQPRTTSADSAAAAAYADTIAGNVSRKRVHTLSAQRDSVARHTARLGAVTVTAT